MTANTAMTAPMKKVLVTGGRKFDNYKLLNSHLTSLAEHWLTIIHGGATGADELASEWAVINDVPCIRHPARWDAHGKAAGPIRNRQMLEWWEPDLVIAFPGGRGTDNCIKQARELGIEVRIATHPTSTDIQK